MIVDELAVERALCKKSFYYFLKAFWHTVIPEKPVFNFHLRYLCDRAQKVCERIFAGQEKDSDLVVNIPPSTSKSTVFSIMLPAWCWTRMPSFRFLGASFAHDLALDLSRKCRDLIKSEKYMELFPNIKLRSDQDTKCLARGTKVLMSSGISRKIENLKVGDRVQSSDGVERKEDTVVAVKSTGVRQVFKITLDDGTVIRATDNHRLFGWDSWIRVRDLSEGDSLAVVETTKPQHGALSQDDAFLLALWLAEGTKSVSGFQFTNQCPEIASRVDAICRQRSWKIKRKGKCFNQISKGSKRSGDTPLNFLRRHKTIGYCRTESIKIPQQVFKASDEVVKEFIGTYISCDGCVMTGPTWGVKITTAGEEMVRDFQMLLKRIGVHSTLNRQRASYRLNGIRKYTKNSWSLFVRRKDSVEKLKDIHIYGKMGKMSDLLNKKRSGRSNAEAIPPQWSSLLTNPGRLSIGSGGWTGRDTVRRFAVTEDNKKLLRKLDGGLGWRKIVGIVADGQVQTYDIQTEKYAAFFANGILSHNSYYANTKGGMRYSVGAGGSPLGRHFHLIVIDDPINPQDALSDLVIKSTNTWIDGSLSTRKVDAKVSAMILVMQRLHQDDPSANMLKRSKVRHICLPATDEYKIVPEIMRKQYKDGLLDPERLSREVLAAWESRGKYFFSGQFGQDPVPLGGGMFDTTRLQIGVAPKMKKECRYWDKAGSLGQGDWTAGVKVGIDFSDRVWIRNVQRVRLDSFRREQLILQTAHTDGRKVLIGVEQEPGSSGKESAEGTARTLMGFSVRLNPVSGKGAKEQRWDPFATQVNAGNVYYEDGPWVKDFVEELRFAPFGTHDDQIDAAAGALSLLIKCKPRVGGVRKHKNRMERYQGLVEKLTDLRGGK